MNNTVYTPVKNNSCIKSSKPAFWSTQLAEICRFPDGAVHWTKELGSQSKNSTGVGGALRQDWFRMLRAELAFKISFLEEREFFFEVADTSNPAKNSHRPVWFHPFDLTILDKTPQLWDNYVNNPFATISPNPLLPEQYGKPCIIRIMIVSRDPCCTVSVIHFRCDTHIKDTHTQTHTCTKTHTDIQVWPFRLHSGLSGLKGPILTFHIIISIVKSTLICTAHRKVSWILRAYHMKVNLQ